MKILTTDTYNKWFSNIKDRKLKALITVRLDRISNDNMGDVKSVGDGVSEIRIHYTSGYRLYFTKQGKEIIILLCGGGKGTQKQDINKAKEMLK